MFFLVILVKPHVSNISVHNDHTISTFRIIVKAKTKVYKNRRRRHVGDSQIFVGRSVVNSDRPKAVFIGGDLFLQLSHRSDALAAAISFDRRLVGIYLTEQSAIKS